jgi:hypothetical protein
MKPLCLVLALLGPMVGRADSPPRYIFFTITPDSVWNQNHPESFTRAVFDQVTQTLHAPENSKLRIGVSFIFNTLESPTNILARSLSRLLACSEQAGVPVLVTLDGQNWWQNRSDLWNWWDPKRPGYNPSNVFNVEWTGWSPTQAVKIGWRDWGCPVRVAPAPNLASPKVLGEQLAALRVLVPILQEWRNRLPESRRWLFGGLKLGWEAGIGDNAYYYPEGNRYLEQWPNDSSHDPNWRLDRAKGLSSGVRQLGYAAVWTDGLKRQGELTPEDLGLVTARYLEALCRVAHEAGIPSDKVFTHQGGTAAPWDQHLPFWAAFNCFSTPGWSFYGLDPRAAGPLDAELQKAGRKSWAACEWWWGGRTAAEWEDHFRRTLSFQDCRFICVYNWNQRAFETQAAGQEAVRALLATWDN